MTKQDAADAVEEFKSTLRVTEMELEQLKADETELKTLASENNFVYIEQQFFLNL
jgi:regulator of replication initiation timing